MGIGLGACHLCRLGPWNETQQALDGVGFRLRSTQPT